MRTKNTQQFVTVRLSSSPAISKDYSWLLADFPDMAEAIQAATEALEKGKADYAFVTTTLRMERRK